MGRVQRRFSSSTGKIRGFLVGPNRGRQKLSSICYVMGWRAVLPTDSSVLDFAFAGNAKAKPVPVGLIHALRTSHGSLNDTSPREILNAGSRAGAKRSSEERKRGAFAEPTRSILERSAAALHSRVRFSRIGLVASPPMEVGFLHSCVRPSNRNPTDTLLMPQNNWNDALDAGEIKIPNHGTNPSLTLPR